MKIANGSQTDRKRIVVVVENQNKILVIRRSEIYRFEFGSSYGPNISEAFFNPRAQILFGVIKDEPRKIG